MPPASSLAPLPAGPAPLSAPCQALTRAARPCRRNASVAVVALDGSMARVCLGHLRTGDGPAGRERFGGAVLVPDPLAAVLSMHEPAVRHQLAREIGLAFGSPPPHPFTGSEMGSPCRFCSRSLADHG